ncbi:hypothetical protein LZ30DRAFT_687206 [Colletotrichum cereale]|nr:hypothetical protein LZ30DRAFT_687206 [Colletotrichum cereale]
MSAPRVFKGREEEVTMEELASLGAATAKSANEGSGDEEIPLIKSDITSSPSAEAQPVIAETKKRRVGRPPKTSRAVKRLKWTCTVNSSQSAAPSAEDSSSSAYGTPDSPSLTIRKVSKVVEHSQTVPNQRLMPVAQMHSSPQEPIQSQADANVRDCNEEDAMPEPVSVPRGRGGPRKKQTPIPVNTTGKGKSSAFQSQLTSLGS